jgi:hypothetical protein
VSRLRHAAALFIEAGRALGQAEQCRQTEEVLASLFRLSESSAPDEFDALTGSLQNFQKIYARHRATAEGHAARARTAAEASMVALEHPGARLARRLLRAARAARGAWLAG